jgi:hypothetical protein
LRALRQGSIDGTARRVDLESFVDVLSNLELELANSAEVALLPADSYHAALTEVLNLPVHAERLSQIVERVVHSLGTEMIAIEIRERYQQEREQAHDMVRNALISAVAIPFTFLIGFFGINASQVNSHYSVFDLHHYAAAYLVAGCLAAFPLLSLLGNRSGRLPGSNVFSSLWRKRQKAPSYLRRRHL